MIGLSRFIVVGLTFATLFMAACSKENSKTELSHVSAAAILSSTSPANEKAETLALQAEELFAANGIDEASRVVKLALKEDPKNARAQFLNALINPFMVVKGVFARFKPLVARSPRMAERHQEEIDNINADKELTANFKSFLLEGSEDVKTEEQAQIIIDQLAKAFKELRKTLKEIAPAEITVKANPVLVPDINERYAAACEIKETANLEFELKCPPSEGRNMVTVNQGDFEMFRMVAATYEMLIASHNAYDATGLIDLLKDLDISGESVNNGTVLQGLLKNPKAGKLRATNQMRNIKEMGLDLVIAARWISSNYSSLCKDGESADNNRPGMWMYQGICLNPQYFTTLLSSAESYFNNAPTDLQLNQNGVKFVTKIKPMSLFEKPVLDLRQLGPFEFDKCGQLKRLGDQTLGGVFPYRNVNEVLTLKLEECD